MKFDNKKVNLLLKEMDQILKRIKATNKGFQEALAERRKEAAYL